MYYDKKQVNIIFSKESNKICVPWKLENTTENILLSFHIWNQWSWFKSGGKLCVLLIGLATNSSLYTKNM